MRLLVAVVLSLTSFYPRLQAQPESLFTVTLTQPVSMFGIKVYNDRIWVLSSADRRLRAFDLAGEEVLRIDPMPHIPGYRDPAARPRDFAVTADGRIHFLGVTLNSETKAPVTYVLRFGPDGALEEASHLPRSLTIHRVEPSGDDLVLLATDEAFHLRAREILRKSPAGVGEFRPVFLLGEGGDIRQVDCSLPLPGDEAELRSRVNGFDTTPLAVDGAGNVYFYADSSQLKVCRPDGEIFGLDYSTPASGRVVPAALLALRSGDLLVAPFVAEADVAGNPVGDSKGLIMRNPVQRTWLLDTARLTAHPVDFDASAVALVGVLSDGRLVSARQRAGVLEIGAHPGF